MNVIISKCEMDRKTSKYQAGKHEFKIEKYWKDTCNSRDLGGQVRGVGFREVKEELSFFFLLFSSLMFEFFFNS